MIIIAEAVLILHSLFFSTELFRIAAVLSALFALFSISFGKFNSRRFFLFSALALGGITSVLFGTAPGPSAEAIGILLGAWGWYSLGSLRNSENKFNIHLGFCSAVTAVLLAMLSALQFLITERPSSLWWLSPIDFGITMLIVGFYGLKSINNSKWKFAYILILASSIALTSSRGILAAFIAGIFIISDISFKRRALLIIIALTISLPIIIKRISNDPFAWNRTRIYACALNLIEERPLAGWGLGSFDAVSQRAQLPDPTEIRRMRTPIHAHNDALQILAELGIPIGSAVIAEFILAWALLYRKRQQVEFAIVTSLFVVSLFYFPFQLALPLFSVMFCLGAGLDSGFFQRNVNPFILPAMALLVYAYGMIVNDPSIAIFDARLAITKMQNAVGVKRMIELEPQRPESYLNLGIFTAQTGNSSSTIYAFEKAVGLAPTRTAVRFDLAQAWLWHSTFLNSHQESEHARKIAMCHMGLIRAIEPLSLAGLDAAGDTIGFMLASSILDRIEISSGSSADVKPLRRRLEF